MPFFTEGADPLDATPGAPAPAAPVAALLPVMMDGISVYLAPRSLGSDAITDAEVAAGKPPSYTVSVKDPMTGAMHMLMDRDNPDKPLRFRPGPMLEPTYAATPRPPRVPLA